MASELVDAAPAREPKQGRSRASYERMLDTALALLRERGNDDFTLQDVAKQGRVSIGSIYYRFESKDELIRAVHAQTMQRVRIDEDAALERAARRGVDLNTLVPALVEEISQMLRQHAPSMAPMMVRAGTDPRVAELGKQSYADFQRRVEALLLTKRDEVRQPDPSRAVAASFTVFYSTIARYLGLGTSPTAVGQGDWTKLKEDIADMLLAYLKHAEPRR